MIGRAAAAAGPLTFITGVLCLFVQVRFRCNCLVCRAVIAGPVVFMVVFFRVNLLACDFNWGYINLVVYG